VLSILLTFELAPLPYALGIVAASAAYGALFTPSFALIAEGADRSGLAQGLAFGMMNAAWALGAMAGPAGAGALAGATGEAFPFVLAALACLATVTLLLRRPRPRLVTTASEG
jgi:MFS family permease